MCVCHRQSVVAISRPGSPRPLTPIPRSMSQEILEGALGEDRRGSRRGSRISNLMAEGGIDGVGGSPFMDERPVGGSPVRIGRKM